MKRIKVTMTDDDDEGHMVDSEDHMVRDIRRQFRRKLRLALKDTVDLFEIADVSVQDGVSVMLSELIFLSTQMLCKYAPDLTPEEFGRMMRGSLAVTKKHEAKGSDG